MKISDSEMELMNIIWDSNSPVTSAGLADMLDTEWKGTTIRTFLKRLTTKGVLTVRQEGKVNYYTPAISREEYKNTCTEEFINEMHSGSLKNLLAAFYSKKQPTQNEIEEIKEWFEKL